MNEKVFKVLAIIALVLGALGCFISIMEMISESQEQPLDVIPPILMKGGNGFNESCKMGPGYFAFFNDTDAFITASFVIKTRGSFDLRIYYVSSGANLGKTASGKLSISAYKDNENMGTWNVINNKDCDLPLKNTNITSIYQSGYGCYNFDANDRVAVLWQKDDDAGGATGVMGIYAIVLVRIEPQPI